MAANVDLLFRFLGDSKDLDRASKSAKKSLDSTEQSSTKLSRGMSTATTAVAGFAAAVGAREIAQFAWDAAQAAEAADDAARSADKVLGPAMEDLRDRIKDVREQLGFSEADFDKLSAKLGLLTEGFGLSDDAQAEFIEMLVRTGGDLAAFNGRTGEAEEAIDALTAAIRGEFDPLEQWGVKLKQSEVNERALALGADSANSALSEQELQILALEQLIAEKAGPAVGALADAEGSLASQSNEASARFDDLKAAIGQRLIPVFATLLKFLLDAWDAWDRLTDASTFWTTRLGSWIRAIQDFINRGLAPITKALDTLSRYANNVKTALDKVFGVNLPDPPKNMGTGGVPRYATGGIVGGPKGQPRLAVVHGGEQITNPAMGQGGGGFTVNISTGIGDPQAIARAVVDALQLYNRTNGSIPVRVRGSDS